MARAVVKRPAGVGPFYDENNSLLFADFEYSFRNMDSAMDWLGMDRYRCVVMTVLDIGI